MQAEKQRAAAQTAAADAEQRAATVEREAQELREQVRACCCALVVGNRTCVLLTTLAC